MFNGYNFGGPLILAGIKPYIDGRADMYGDAFVLEWWDIVQRRHAEVRQGSPQDTTSAGRC